MTSRLQYNCYDIQRACNTIWPYASMRSFEVIRFMTPQEFNEALELLDTLYPIANDAPYSFGLRLFTLKRKTYLTRTAVKNKALWAWAEAIRNGYTDWDSNPECLFRLPDGPPPTEEV